MLSETDCSQLSRWVQRFVLEARKKDGTEFQSTTLHHIVACLMRLSMVRPTTPRTGKCDILVGIKIAFSFQLCSEGWEI